ncbi:sigma-54-dependent transcriptional regulator [Salinicola corii]|nr:sigma-54 dependent transcriptional regulator [Salinicola corii]
MSTILLVEDDAALAELIEEEVRDQGHETVVTAEAEAALKQLSGRQFDLVVSDVRLSGEMSGIELLQRSRDLTEPPPFIVITAFGTIEQAVHCLHLGADDFLTKPIELDELATAIDRVLTRRAVTAHFDRSRHAATTREYHGMLSGSSAMHNLFDQIGKLAASDAPTLVQGESGTGKELVARALHADSRRQRGPFVAVNCASISPELMESEFFGHRRGAFTGAASQREGYFAEADGGTLFLDEIGEMSLALQGKLLRAIQESAIRPLGADRDRSVDVRIVAATNRQLEVAVAENQFRQDLFYRLETLTLKVLPLRERGRDKEILAHHFIETLASAQGKAIREVDPLLITALLDYAFPGNIRELENAITRCVTLAVDGVLSAEDLPSRMREPVDADRQTVIEVEKRPNDWQTLKSLEAGYIRKVLEATEGNKRRTAEILGISRKTLYRKLEDA